MTASAHEIEGTAVEVHGAELEHVEHHAPPPTTLFRTDDPVEVVEKASRVADALKDVIVKRHLFKNIQGRDHVLVEGWTTLGSMLGVVPVVAWSRPTGEPSEHGHDWEARVEARTLDGRVIGAAEALCSRKERTWAQRDDYALRSMAQTRATSKALRGPLGFIVTLAGYAATPAEEMPAEQPRQQRQQRRRQGLGPKALASLNEAFNAYVEAGCPPDMLEVKLLDIGATVDDGDIEEAFKALTRDQGAALHEWMRGEVAAHADATSEPEQEALDGV